MDVVAVAEYVDVHCSAMQKKVLVRTTMDMLKPHTDKCPAFGTIQLENPEDVEIQIGVLDQLDVDGWNMFISTECRFFQMNTVSLDAFEAILEFLLRVENRFMLTNYFGFLIDYVFVITRTLPFFDWKIDENPAERKDSAVSKLIRVALRLDRLDTFYRVPLFLCEVDCSVDWIETYIRGLGTLDFGTLYIDLYYGLMECIHGVLVCRGNGFESSSIVKTGCQVMEIVFEHLYAVRAKIQMDRIEKCIDLFVKYFEWFSNMDVRDLQAGICAGNENLGVLINVLCLGGVFDFARYELMYQSIVEMLHKIAINTITQPLLIVIDKILTGLSIAISTTISGDASTKIVGNLFLEELFEHYFLVFDQPRLLVFENVGTETRFYQMMLGTFCEMYRTMYEGDHSSDDERAEFLDRFYLRISMFSLVEEDLSANSNYLKYMQMFVRFAGVSHHQRLIDQAYSFVMSRFRISDFDELYPMYSPFVKQLVTSSNNKDDLGNICNMYAKLYLETESESRKNTVLNELLSISELLLENAHDKVPARIELADLFFVFFIDLFVEICESQTTLIQKDIQRVNQTICSFFPSLAVVMENAWRIVDLERHRYRIYEVWNFIVYFAFTLENHVLEELEDCISRIVKYTPPMLDIVPSTKIELDKGLIVRIRERLLKRMGNTGGMFETCSANEIMYYWILYTLEYVRYRNRFDPDVDRYMGHVYSGIDGNRTRDLVFGVCSKTLVVCVDGMGYMYAREVMMLVLSLLPRIPQIRDLVVVLSGKYPFLFVDEMVLHRFFEAVEEIQRISFSDQMDIDKSLFSDDPQAKFDLFKDTIEFGETIIINALHVAPTLTHYILHGFLLSINDAPLGTLFKLILSCLSKYNALPNNWNELVTYKNSFFTFFANPLQTDTNMAECLEQALETLDPGLILTSIHLIHRDLEKKRFENLLIFLDMLGTQWTNMIARTLKSRYIDPFSGHVSYERSGDVVGDQNKSIMITYILSYVNERVVYDSLHFRDMKEVQTKFMELFRVFVESFDKVVDFRTIGFQIINFGFHLAKGERNISGGQGDRIRKALCSMLAKMFTLSNKFLNNDTKTLILDNSVKEKCKLLILENVKEWQVGERAGLSILRFPNTDNLSSSLQTTSDLLEFFGYLLGMEIWNSRCQEPGFEEPFESSVVMTEQYVKALIKMIGFDFPVFSVSLIHQFSSIRAVLVGLFLHDPMKFVDASELLVHMDSREMQRVSEGKKEYFDVAKGVVPVEALSLLQKHAKNVQVCRYAIRSLLMFGSDMLVFYIPQMIQLLREDCYEIVFEFILHQCQQNQMFTHQIIWNIQANTLDETSSLKKRLQEVRDRIVDRLVGRDREFYEREFGFFERITAISRVLKPLARKSKAVKKAKIDEEMKEIGVEGEVYLPSNPESMVVDIEQGSGKPLQSRAKAPFMASFKVRSRKDKAIMTKAIIFKVGDDCRQDMMTLQLIMVFREIYRSVGLDLYLFPYRVVATAPGCGVIEVIPNSISRDQLGRERINGLYDYFVFKFGPEKTSPAFYRARRCFIKSLAAYSIVSYLLAIRDRHNGNIMIDDSGHIIHIDFGFILDMAPGGIRFERSPFKLTREMIRLMGDGPDTSYFEMFRDLCVKAYLALRPYSARIVALVSLLMKSNLPCFRSRQTAINNLWTRFQLDLSVLDAKRHVHELIRKAYDNTSTRIYDSFQYRTNAIPY